MSDDVRATLLRILGRIAPEGDYDDLEPDDSLREQLDLDSMDFLAFMRGIHDELGIEVPELDYPQLDSLDDAVEYVSKTRQS
jgi:acyl carrier protein